MYADVVVNRPTHRRPPTGSDPLRGDNAQYLTYTYHLPERLGDAATVGHLVQVPLATSTALGIIVALMDSPPAGLPADVEIRDVDEIVDPLPVVAPYQIELARWIAGEYLAPLSEAMRLMLPPDLESRTWIVVKQIAGTPLGDLTSGEKAALGALESHRGRLSLEALARHVGGDNPEAVIDALASRGLVDARYTLVPPRPAPPRVRFARLLADDATIDAALPRLGHASKQADALLVLAHRPGEPLILSELCERAGCTDGPVRSLGERGWVEIAEPPSASLDLPGAKAIDLSRAPKQLEALMVLAHHSGAPMTLDELCRRADCTSGPVKAVAERGWVEITERRTVVVLLPHAELADLKSTSAEAAVVEHLRTTGGSSELVELLQATGASTAIVGGLEAQDVLRTISEPEMILLVQPADLIAERVAEFRSSIREPVVRLSLRPDQLLDGVLELRSGLKHRAVLDALRGTTDRVWVGGIYAQTGADLSTLRDLADRGLISLHAKEYDRPQIDAPEKPPCLTADQQSVWQQVERGIREQRAGGEPFVGLLHGVTGSGKTEIYLRALAETLTAGYRAIVLVPEISLTPQAVRRFEARFPGRVAVVHSQLSLGHRYAVWDRVRRGEADVLIGSRLALFAPMARVGLVVLDEAHDGSYKQSEPIPGPAYDARETAIALGRLTGAAVLLGSATPDLVSYYRASQGTYRLLDLPRRIVSPVRSPEGSYFQGQGGSLRNADAAVGVLPAVRVVDLRQELRAGNRSIFSRVLQNALRNTLAAGEQAILFLNRRGAATFVLCRDCGYVARCPTCDVPLTLHRRKKAEELVCHHCNRHQPAPSRCPGCGGRRIRYFGLGTERVEDAVRQLYPDARLLRWDRDTASGDDHEQFLQAFVDHRADVLIGTQMIAKGLDLPLITLVGVISADTALYLPDYRSSERTFDLLTQVAGRAGRSHRGGQVIVQTYNPDHYAIRAAAQHDYAGFYRQELAYRRQLGYPPFSRLVALRFSDRDASRCRTEAERLARWLAAESRRLGLGAHLVGPAPCYYSQVQGQYRWQIVVRAEDPLPLLRDVALPVGWRVDVDPIDLL